MEMLMDKTDDKITEDQGYIYMETDYYSFNVADEPKDVTTTLCKTLTCFCHFPVS